MATAEEIFEQFDTIEDNVFNNITARTAPCNGPACDTSVTAPKGYVCTPCGNGPNQGYLARDTGADIAFSDKFSNIMNSIEALITGNSPKEKFTIEAIKLLNLDLQISAKIKELYDYKQYIASMTEIINKELESLV